MKRALLLTILVISLFCFIPAQAQNMLLDDGSGLAAQGSIIALLPMENALLVQPYASEQMHLYSAEDGTLETLHWPDDWATMGLYVQGNTFWRLALHLNAAENGIVGGLFTFELRGNQILTEQKLTIDWTPYTDDAPEITLDDNRPQPTALLGSAMTSDKFYVLAETGDGDAVVSVYDLATGARHEMSGSADETYVALAAGPAEELFVVTRAGEGTPIGQSNSITYVEDTADYTLYLVNPVVRSAQQITCFHGTQPFGLAWDDASGRLIFSLQGGVYAIFPQPEAEAVQVAVNPLHDARQACMLSGEVYAVSFGAQAALRDVKDDNFQPVTLTVFDTAGISGQVALAFSRTEPKLQVCDAFFQGMEADDVVDRLLTQSDEIDVYILDSYEWGELTTAMLNKGFALPLDNETLLCASERLYPQIQNLCMSEGQLTAWPASINPLDTIGINVELYRSCMCEEAQIPSDWFTFLDFIDTITPQALDSNDLFLFDPEILDGGDLREWLIHKLNQSVMLNLTTGDGEVGFDSSVYQALVERILSINPTMCARYLEYEGEVEDAQCLFYTDYHLTPMEDNNTIFSPMPLALQPGEVPLMGFSCVVMMVNPWSQHPQEALDFIVCVAQNTAIEVQAMLYADYTGLVRPENYQSTLSMYDNLIQQARDAQNAQEEETYILSRIDYAQNAWLISDESLKRYQSQTPYLALYINRLDAPDTLGAGAVPDAVNALVNGQMSLQDYMILLERLVMMPMWEQG